MRSIRPFMLTVLTAAALTVGTLSPASAAASTASTVTAGVTAAASMTATSAFQPPIAAKTYYLSSHFGPRCIPVQGGSTYHQGVDLAAKAGTPIYAIAAGVVTATVDGTSSRAGYISVRHSIDGAQYTSTYMHIWSATTQVTVGQAVTAGQRISEVGNSGVSSGSHLHLELWKAGSTGSQAQDAAAFLRQRGIDLYSSATAVTAPATPATCTYYTVGAVNFRTGPSTGYSILRTLPSGTAMTHIPGSITAGFIPVSVGTQSGWISASYVSPTKPAAPVTAPAPTYATTAPLNLRVSPSTSAARILVIPQGANVGVILASSDVWRKVTYAGRTGWVHSAYLVKR
jgi:murein DD-endopeptidase MepM/ murein hydrolase activator NlpD